MFEVHAETRIVKFPTLKRALNYLEDSKRQVRKANDVLGKVYIVDTKATSDYTTKNPNRLKSQVFVRWPGSLPGSSVDENAFLEAWFSEEARDFWTYAMGNGTGND